MMKSQMKSIIAALSLAFPLALTAAGPSAEEMAFYKAYKNGAQAKECLRVVDQDGRPVVGAKIDGGLQTGDGYNDYTPIRGATDTNGEFVVQGKCTNRIRCGITLDGYYASEFVLPNYASRRTFRDGKWHPYGSQHTVVLKKIINPQPMIFHDERASFKVPVYEEWVGFDCEKFEKYSRFAPQLKSIPSKLDKIKIGAPIVVANIEVKHNQSLMAEMLNRLCGLQGQDMLTQEFFDFLGKYECHSVGHNQHTLIGHKNKADRICRWCGGTLATNATFNKKGHAISEALGNKSIVLCDECDTCNEMFGKTIEEVAATYYSFENTLFGIHGKNGIPKIKTSDCESIENNGCSCISVKATTFHQQGEKPPTQVTIKAPKKIVEQDVYRCFCKYALSCCKDDVFVHFKHLVPWLRKEVDYDKTPWLLAYRHPNLDVETGSRMEQPIMNMYIRRHDDNTMPYFICELHHTIHTHLFIVPRDDDERIRFSSREKCIELWRKLPFVKERCWENIYDMSGTVPHDYKCIINIKVNMPMKNVVAG